MSSADPTWIACRSVLACSVELCNGDDGEWIGYNGRVDLSHAVTVPNSCATGVTGCDSALGEPRIHTEPGESVGGECSKVDWLPKQGQSLLGAGPSEPAYWGHIQTVDIESSSCLPKGSSWLHDANDCDRQGPEVVRLASYAKSASPNGQGTSGPSAQGRQVRSEFTSSKAVFGELPGFGRLGIVGEHMGDTGEKSTPPVILHKASNTLYPLYQPNKVHGPPEEGNRDSSVFGNHERLINHVSYWVQTNAASGVPGESVPEIAVSEEQDGWCKAERAMSSQDLYPLRQALSRTDAGLGTCQPQWGTEGANLNPVSADSDVAVLEACMCADRRPWMATWFSQAHVCGSRCFPPPTSKKVQAGVTGTTQWDSSSESSLYEDEEVNASTPCEANTPAPQFLCRTPSGLGPYPVSQPLISSDQVVVDSVGAAEATFGGVSLDSVQLDAAELNAVLQSAQAQGQVSRLLTSAFQGFDLACEISETAVLPHHRIHESLGFNFPLPQEPGSSSPAYRSLGFSPDLSQAQGLPNGNATGDPSYRFPACNPDSPEGERFPINEVNSAPEQYEIYSDDDDASLEADSDPQSLWDQSWVNLTDLPPDPSWPREQGSDGCNALSVSIHVPRARGRSDTTTVTWHVPLGTSASYLQCRSNNLDLSPGFVLFRKSIASQVLQGGILFLPNLACIFMSRLLTWQVSPTQAIGKQFVQSTPDEVVSASSCWTSSLSTCARAVSPAPSMHQSDVLFATNLPGCASVSGAACDNMLALACARPRWGESSPPETNFEFLCVPSLVRTWT